MIPNFWSFSFIMHLGCCAMLYKVECTLPAPWTLIAFILLICGAIIGCGYEIVDLSLNLQPFVLTSPCCDCPRLPIATDPVLHYGDRCGLWAKEVCMAGRKCYSAAKDYVAKLGQEANLLVFHNPPLLVYFKKQMLNLMAGTFKWPCIPVHLSGWNTWIF